MSTLREKMIQEGLIKPASASNENQSKEKWKLQEQTVAPRRTRIEAKLPEKSGIEPLERLRPAPRDSNILLKIIDSWEDAPKSICGRLRWLIYTQNIYFAGADITEVRRKTARQVFTKLEKELYRLQKHWEATSRNFDYLPDRHSSGELKEACNQLLEKLRQDKAIEDESLRDCVIKFIKYHLIECVRQKNVRETLRNLPYTPDEERVGRRSILQVGRRATKRW